MAITADSGTGGGGSGLTTWFNAVSPSQYDIYDSSAKSSMFFRLDSSVNSLTVYNTKGYPIYVYKIEILYNDNSYHKFTTFSTEIVVAGYQGRNSYKKVTGAAISNGSSRSFSIVCPSTSNIPIVSSTSNIYVKVYYSTSVASINDGLTTTRTFDTIGNLVALTSENKYAGFFQSYSPYVDSISLSGSYQTSFYKNAAFNHTNQVVTAYYKYYVNGGSAGSQNVTSSAQYSSPTMTTTGSKTITVSYGGKSATYTIYVYGITSMGADSGFRFYYRYLVDSGPDLPTSITITYGNGTSRTVTRASCSFAWQTYDFSSTGSKTCKATFYDSYTNETVEMAFGLVVRDVSAISVKTNPTKTVYKTNETHSNAGLVLTATYGNAGTFDIGASTNPVSLSGVTIVSPYMGSIGTKDVGIAYRCQTTKYQITVNGMTGMRLYVPDEIKKVLKGGSLSTTGLQVFYTRSDVAETEIQRANWGSTAASDPHVSLDTSEVNLAKNGTYTITVSIEYYGITMSETYEVEVYSLDSLALSNYQSEFIKTGSTNPTFATGALSVVAHFSDGSERTLSNSEYTVSQPSNMDVGPHTVTVTATIGSTISETYSIEVVEDYPVEVTSVVIDNWNDTYSAGQVFSKTGIIVRATMHSGITNKQVDFTTSLDGDVFGTDIEEDTTFSIFVATNDPENPLEVEYDDAMITKDGEAAELEVLYDELISISVDGGQQTSAIRWMRAGDQFTDYINENNRIVVTATYAHRGTVTVPRGDYALSKVVGTIWTKDDMGDNTITVTYGGKTDTYVVRISKLFSIDVTTSRNPNQYNRYEVFDTSEITIKKKYTYDGENADLGSLNVSVDDVTISGCYEQLVPDNVDGKTTTLTFSYTEAGVTCTDTLSVTVKRLIDVSLDVSKINTNFGESVPLVGHEITLTYNTEEVYQYEIGAGNRITIGGVSYDLAIKGLDSNIIRNKVTGVQIGFTFGQETVYDTIDVHCIYLGAITLDASYYTGSTLYAGDTLSLTNLSLTKSYYSTDEDDENYPITSALAFNSNGVSINISEGQILVAGNNTINVTYITGVGDTEQMKTTSVTLTALEIALSSISADDSGLEKALSAYVEGQALNLAGLVVSAVFNRTASNRNLNLNELKFYIGSTEISGAQVLSTSDNSKSLKVSFTYNGVTKEATVGTLTVVAKALTSIAVKSGSTQSTSFAIGDKFSTEGLIITATYNDGYEEDLVSGFTTDFDSYKTTPFASAQVGASQAVTVTYVKNSVTKTCSYNINVNYPEMVSLRFDTSLIPLSVTNGTSYSVSALDVYGVFDNGYEELLTKDADSSPAAGEWWVSTDLTRDGSNNVYYSADNLGVKQMAISAKDPYDATNVVVANLNVTVTPNLELQDIRLRFDEENYDPFNYRVGDIFDAKGLIVEAKFKDTDWVEVADYETNNPYLGTLLRSGGRLTVTVRFTSQNVMKTADYVITVTLPYENNAVEEKTYKVAFNVASVTHEEATIEFSEDTQLPLFNANYIDVDTTTGSSTYGLNVYTGNNANEDCIGYMKLGKTSEIDGSVIENAQVVLFDDPVNPIDGDGNIIVKFPHYVDGYADRINGCRFGIIYNKRLFVAGNETYPNIDWHSSEVNSAQVEHYETEEDKDLTYFSDLDYCKYGSEISAIKGYDIYRDGTLLVFKEKSQHEATIYTRTTQLVNASSYDGTVVNEGELAEEAYPCFEVNPNGGAGAISPDLIINFVGETLVLTKNGLKAITSKEVTYNNAKYSYDVSSHINNKLLKNNNLDYAVLSQYKEKLLLMTNEGLYIGEYKLRDENSEYEWYFCDNIDAYYFFELDDDLYFSDEEGNINRFVDDGSINVKDKPRTYVGLAGTTLSIDANTDVIIVSETYAKEITEGKEFHLLNKISAITGGIDDESQIYATMGTFINKNLRQYNIDNNVISFDQTAYAGLIDPDANEIIIKSFNAQGNVDYERMNNTKLFFYDGRNVYIDSIEGIYPNVAVDTRYYLKRVENINQLEYHYKLYDEFDREVNLTGANIMRICFRVNELAVAYIMDAEAYQVTGKQFRVGVPLKADENGDVLVPLDLIYYNNRTSGTYRGVITDHINVLSYLIPKALNLGSDVNEKTIHQWVLINDSSIPSMMNVGYIASRKYGDFQVAVKEIGGARKLAFSEGFNFDKLHFTNDKLPHIYSRTKVVPRVGYVRFIFFNDEGTRMVISKLEIIYTNSLIMKGVR